MTALFTKDAVLTIARFAVQKYGEFPERANNAVFFLLARLEGEAVREGYPIITAANVLDVAVPAGFDPQRQS